MGIDYDYRMINVANRVRTYNNSANTSFYVFDLENEPLELIDNFLPDGQADIVFLLSICMWIENWRDVVRKGRDIADTMLFESNGSPEQQDEQEAFLGEVFADVLKIRDSSPDDPGQKARKLFLCRA